MHYASERRNEKEKDGQTLGCLPPKEIKELSETLIQWGVQRYLLFCDWVLKRNRVGMQQKPINIILFSK
jgi:hypothetical protein